MVDLPIPRSEEVWGAYRTFNVDTSGPHVLSRSQVQTWAEQLDELLSILKDRGSAQIGFTLLDSDPVAGVDDGVFTRLSTGNSTTNPVFYTGNAADAEDTLYGWAAFTSPSSGNLIINRKENSASWGSCIEFGRAAGAVLIPILSINGPVYALDGVLTSFEPA
jgi:hypothetical protein